MSHFSLIRIKIKNPNVNLLKKAVEMIAKELGGQTVTQIYDYYGRAMDVTVGLVSANFRRGVGVKVNERGEVEIVGDFWGVSRSAVEKFQQLLVQNYASLAMQTALAQLGYQIQAQKVQNKVYIRGVAP
jgi:hypothetical protein